jgi:hypothetical protein
MAEPYLKFVYNHSDTDSEYDFYTGNANWRTITPGIDTVIFTGGGIEDFDEGISNTALDTLASGTRSPTIRPAVTFFDIPFTFMESGALMYRIPLAGNNTNRFVFGVSVSGTIEGNCYLEAWDDFTFSTYTSEVLTGSLNSGSESYVNAIRTTDQTPPCHTFPLSCWTGVDTGANFLRGDTNRVGLGAPPVTDIIDEVLFFNIYIRLQTDSPTFHNTPVFGFRYLYT